MWEFPKISGTLWGVYVGVPFFWEREMLLSNGESNGTENGK